MGYEPDEVDRGVFTTDGLRRTAGLAATVIVVVAVVGAVGAGTYQQVSYERSVNAATSEVLQRDAYSGLGVVAVTAEYIGIGPLFEPSTVTVTLSRTSDRSYGGLPNELANAIDNRTGERVTVQVRYRDYDRSNVSTARRSRPSAPQAPASG